MPKKILLIDDEPKLVDMVKMRLEANGYDVITASNGEEGMKKAVNEKPNLIILDIRMPKKDGHTFAKEARVNRDIKHIPIIIISWINGLKDLFEFEGINDYIEKPFDDEVLLKKVDHYLKD
jgi:DNA-binding response OmpR family regulator